MADTSNPRRLMELSESTNGEVSKALIAASKEIRAKRLKTKALYAEIEARDEISRCKDLEIRRLNALVERMMDLAVL